MSASDLQRAAEREARLVDELTATFADELLQVVRLISARIREWALQLEKSDGRITATRVNLSLALQVRKVLLDSLADAGYTDLVAAATDEPLDRLAAIVLRSGSEGARIASLGGLDTEILIALKTARFDQLLDVGEEAAATLWRVVLDGVVGARSVPDLLQDVEDTLDVSTKRARVIYDTAVSTFSRQVDQIHATGEADEVFFYVGPVDRKMRPFCRERVGKVFTRAEVEAMDNGQLPNVLLTAGGFSCRHQFRRVSRFDADLLELVGTGRRHPSVQERIDNSAHLAGAAA